MNYILDGKKVADSIKEDIAKNIIFLKEEYGIVPCLATVLVDGIDPSSEVYVRSKIKTCNKLGIKSVHRALPNDVSLDRLIETIIELNEDEDINGILVQFPLKNADYERTVIETLDYRKDVDGFTARNKGMLSIGHFYPQLQDTFLQPCTPLGIMKLFEYYGISAKGRYVTILGRSDLVGRPLSNMLSSKDIDATVTLCHSRTKILKRETKKSDIIVCAMGQEGFLRPDMVREGVIIIDVGINRNVDGKLVGDVDPSVYEKASYITPVPGGVGPMTIAMLMFNTLKATYLTKNLSLK